MVAGSASLDPASPYLSPYPANHLGLGRQYLLPKRLALNGSIHGRPNLGAHSWFAVGCSYSGYWYGLLHRSFPAVLVLVFGPHQGRRTKPWLNVSNAGSPQSKEAEKEKSKVSLVSPG